MNDDAEIDFKFSIDGIIIESRDQINGFYEIEGVSHGFSQINGFPMILIFLYDSLEMRKWT